MAPYDYTWEEWLSHMETHLQSTVDDPKGVLLGKWFRSHYPDQQEADWKGARLFYARARMNNMLFNNPESFGNLHADGSVFSLTSIHIIRVFWSLYSAIPDEHLKSYVPDLNEVLSLALEAQASQYRTAEGLPDWLS